VILPIDANTKWEYVDERHEGARFYNEYIRNLKKMTSEICRLRLDKYDEKRKAYYDKNKKDGKFKIGDKVIWYKGSDQQGKKGKVKSKWKGPYIIKETWNANVNY